MYKHIFGPVPSRRLGMSLGVDMVPKKVCSLNCVYCEVGPTTRLTSERKPYVPAEDIIRELQDYFRTQKNPDFITFSGYGEPTLNSEIGTIFDYLKREKPEVPIAVLTNGTLLFEKEVREAIMRADLVLPSLDSATEEGFKRINHPVKTISLRQYIEGLVTFRQEFTGQIWLEVFILPGYNDSITDLDALKKELLRIKPDKIQLNTLDRPGTVSGLRSATRQELQSIIDYWDLPNVEIIAAALERTKMASYRKDVENVIVETINRRPCTLDDLSKILGLHVNELNKYLDALEASGKVHTERQDRGLFYMIRKDTNPEIKNLQ
ncbi:MAG TPA: radical SAM protein [Bacteroidales bacterium]|nr:radical SAM protein [Bacteroidales bacterium]